MKPQTFNDLLALVLCALIMILWAGAGRGWLTLPGEIIGGTLMAFGAIVQFYFRKARDEDST